MRLGSIVLCGGKSTRMGADKASLPFGDETMLARVVRLLSVMSRPIVVVTAAGQARQALPVPCRFATDERPDRGPLEGLAAGLRAIGNDADAVYATSCDVPLLVPAVVTALAERLGDHDIDKHDIAVPWDGKYHHPLSAVYRIGVLPKIDELLAADRLRPVDLFNLVPTNRVSTEELRTVDPELETLRNLNRPEDYLAALAATGFAPPPGFHTNARRESQI
jgi:molybdopterin-guanine dinucleotide biosynthesis protein A